MEQLTKNFSWEEFIYSYTAEMKGIKNTPPADKIDMVKRNAKLLCDNVLQPLRDLMGPLTISSGYSCPELSKILGRKPTSQHCNGMAADIISNEYSALQLAKTIKQNFHFDQLIFERRFLKSGKMNEWVHVSYKSEHENRNEVLYSPPSGGYTRGLPSA